MKEHFNLYYLFLEDKKKNPMPKNRRDEIREELISLFSKNKMEAQRLRESQGILVELKDGSRVQVFLVEK